MERSTEQADEPYKGFIRQIFLKFALPITAWLLYLTFVFLFPNYHDVIPTPLVIAIPVLVTGGTMGLFGGIFGGLVGLPMTLLAHHIFNPSAENLPATRLVISTVAYCIIGGVGGMLHDLRNRLNTELNNSRRENQIRQRVQQELAESEKNYRNLFEMESDAIFIIQNQDGAILEVNSAACDLYGYSREELLALKNTNMSAEPEETRASTQRTAPMDQVVKIPLRWHRKKDGTVFPVDITARFIQWKGRSVHVAAIRDITERWKTDQELERLAITDPLTGLLNRRQFFHEAEELFSRAMHHPYELSILMIDLDHFKNVNDQHGHAAGDATLREVAARLRDNVRPTDVLGRYGGEEFAIILPRTDMEETRHIADRLCITIANRPIIVDNINIPVTISMGLAGLDEHISSLDELLQHADQALYKAKAAGRNRYAEWKAKQNP